MVSPWSSYFAIALLLVHLEATREVLLNAIRHPYDRASTQVERAGSKEAVVPGEASEEADTKAGEVLHTGKLSCLLVETSADGGGVDES